MGDFPRCTLALLVAALLAAGCVPHPSQRIGSGRPGIVIPGASREAVAARIARDSRDNGFEAEAVAAYRLVFVKRLHAAAAFQGRDWFEADPLERISYYLSETPDGIRVVAMLEVVTDPGSPRGKAVDVSGGPDGDVITEYLRKIAVALDRGKAGIIGVEVERGGEVTAVYRGSPAAAGGISVGDRIVAIDGGPCEPEDVPALLGRLRGPPGTPVTVTLLHGGTERTVSLIRQ